MVQVQPLWQHSPCIISLNITLVHCYVQSSCQGAMVLMNSVCNKLLRPIDGSCCQTLPSPNLLQKLSACFFLGSALVFLVLHVLGNNRHRRPVPPDVESLEEKKPATAAVPLGPKALFQALCRMGIIMGYFYLCDRADVFMKEQKFYTHSTFFIPLIYIFVLGVFYSENSKEVRWRCSLHYVLFWRSMLASLNNIIFQHKIKSSTF